MLNKSSQNSKNPLQYAKGLKLFAWLISVATIVVSVLAWGQTYSWHVSKISFFGWFPLFGLLAFGLMWAHYVVSAIRQYLGIAKSVIKSFYEITSFMVLIALFLHPGLLAWQQWRFGLGLPPGSTLKYTAHNLAWVVMLGIVSWLIFLTYEFRRKFSNNSWWQYVEYATDFAMLLVFYHGLRLGLQTRNGWFKIVWLGYGATLVASLMYIYVKKYKRITVDKHNH